MPAEPPFYAVIFEYLTTHDPVLTERIDFLKKNPALLFDRILQLYDDFIAFRQNERLKVFRHKMNDVIVETTYSLLESSDSFKNYSQTLSKIDQLAQTQSNDAAIKVISLLVDETVTINERSNALEKKLRDSVTQMNSLQVEYLEVKEKALKDPLTQLLSRRGLDEAFNQTLQASEDTPTSCALKDIDHFKEFNDNYGHIVGDNVLKLVASTLNNNIKRSDILSRFGGEEFLLVLPDTNIDQAKLVADKLRVLIEKLVVKRKGNDQALRQITVSIGVAQMQIGESLYSTLERADVALYKAKNSGRNKFISTS
ncbi:MAG: diguanylate cyclase [Kangiellaceae bacterium]|nr:diguanylate cyclase [Kangiellaceae bacterium]